MERILITGPIAGFMPGTFQAIYKGSPSLPAVVTGASVTTKAFLDPQADALKSASDTVEDQEDEHLYHTKGWSRELWLESLGLKAVLPPPEERRHVKTAIDAARAEQAAEKDR